MNTLPISKPERARPYSSNMHQASLRPANRKRQSITYCRILKNFAEDMNRKVPRAKMPPAQVLRTLVVQSDVPYDNPSLWLSNCILICGSIEERLKAQKREEYELVSIKEKDLFSSQSFFTLTEAIRFFHYLNAELSNMKKALPYS